VPIGTPTTDASSATWRLVTRPRKNSGLSQALPYQCQVRAGGGKLTISWEKKLGRDDCRDRREDDEIGDQDQRPHQDTAERWPLHQIGKQ